MCWHGFDQPRIENADDQTVIVIPGGRAALAAYKQERDPVLKARLKNTRW